MFFSNLLLTLIRNVLLPLVYFYVASAAAGAMLPGEPLKRIAAGIKKVVTWALTGSLVLFTRYPGHPERPARHLPRRTRWCCK